MVRRHLPHSKNLEEYERQFGQIKPWKGEDALKSVEEVWNWVGKGDGKGYALIFPATRAIPSYYFVKGVSKVLFPKAKTRIFWGRRSRSFERDDFNDFQRDVYGEEYGEDKKAEEKFDKKYSKKSWGRDKPFSAHEVKSDHEFPEFVRNHLERQTVGLRGSKKIIIVDNHDSGTTSDRIMGYFSDSVQRAQREGKLSKDYEMPEDEDKSTYKIKLEFPFSSLNHYTRDYGGHNPQNVAQRYKHLFEHPEDVGKKNMDVTFSKSWHAAQEMGMTKEQFLNEVKKNHFNNVLATYDLGIVLAEEFKRKKEQEKKSLERRVISSITIASFGAGIFFLSPSLTGNAISDLSIKTTSFLGAGLLIVGLIAGFFWLRSKKK